MFVSVVLWRDQAEMWWTPLGRITRRLILAISVCAGLVWPGASAAATQTARVPASSDCTIRLTAETTCTGPLHVWSYRSGNYQALIRFDVKQVIPDNAQILSATLHLREGYGGMPHLNHERIDVYPVLDPWNDSATWITFDGTTTWSEPRGTYGGASLGPAAPTQVVPFDTGFRADVTEVMQLWSRGSLPPDGLVLSSHRNPHVTQQATDSFASSEAAGQAPYVEVNYVEPPEEPGLQAQAAAWYAQTYGVTLEEATRRLEFQDDVSLIVEDVVNALGPDYAGMWFDAVDGGRLKIGVATTASEPSGPGVDEAKAILSAGGLLGRSDFLSKESSVNSLSAALPGLEDRLASLLAVGKVSIGMRARLNALVISVANDLSTAEVAEVSDAAAQTPVATRVLSTGEPSGGAVFEACSRGGAVPATLYCDRPLRGGVRITSPDARACTSGFMAKDRDDPDKRYVLTAGHCLSQGAEWMTRNVSGEQFLIGSRVAG